MRTIGTVVLAVLVSSTVFAQPNEARRAARTEPLAKLAFLVGDWEGEGWFGRPEATLHQTEKVRWASGKAAILVEGLGIATAGPAKGEVGHAATGLLTYDPAAKSYLWRTATLDGDGQPKFDVVGEKHIVWSMERPGQQIRYTITFPEPDVWHEVGERSADGSAWTKFFEMTLRRK